MGIFPEWTAPCLCFLAESPHVIVLIPSTSPRLPPLRQIKGKPLLIEIKGGRVVVGRSVDALPLG